ncbi:unnamed protein product [Closterium sp. NIES-65]|nr:unnamed protein product [Closterium sp. NIES-65]
MACRNRKSREKPGNFDYERTKCEDSDFRMEDLHKPGGGQQARGAPGRAAGAWAAGQQRRPHQRLRLQLVAALVGLWLASHALSFLLLHVCLTLFSIATPLTFGCLFFPPSTPSHPDPARPSQARGRAAGEQQARGAPGRAAEAGKAAEGSLEEKGRGGRDEATALLAALHLPVKSLFLIFVPHLCLLRIVHTPCFLFAPETFATGWGQPHKPQTLPLTSVALPLYRPACVTRTCLLCWISRQPTDHLCMCLAGGGERRGCRYLLQVQVTPSGAVAPPCSRLANSLLALALSPFLPSLPTDQLCVCLAGGGEGRGSTPTLPHAPPLWPCRYPWGWEGGSTASRCHKGEYQGHLASSEDGALPLAATRESIGPERGREHSSMGGTVASRLSFTPPPLFHPLLRPEEGREHWSKGGTEATLLSSSPPSLRLPPPHFPTRLRHHGATQGT